MATRQLVRMFGHPVGLAVGAGITPYPHPNPAGHLAAASARIYTEHHPHRQPRGLGHRLKTLTFALSPSTLPSLVCPAALSRRVRLKGPDCLIPSQAVSP